MAKSLSKQVGEGNRWVKHRIFRNLDAGGMEKQRNHSKKKGYIT